MKRIVTALAVFVLMTGYAYASAEWEFYGEALVYTVWTDSDEIDGPGGDTNFSQGLYDGSAIGASVKVSDELSGHFEYGAADGNADVVLLYGEWNFGPGTLTVGKAYSPINVTYSNQLVAGPENQDLGLGGFGDFDQSEITQVKLTYGGFSIAILNPEKEAYSDTDGTLHSDLGTETQAVIPMIALGYKAVFDMGEIQIAGGYNTFEIADDEDVDSYGIGLGTQLNFGAFGVFGTFVWGENIANLGTATGTEYAGQAVYMGGEVYDCESIGGTIGVTFAVNDMFSLEAGYGYIHDDYDQNGLSTSIAQSYYLQAPISLAQGVTVTPEIGMIDEREAGTTETLYYGAAWSIAF